MFALGMYLITDRTMPSNNRLERSRVPSSLSQVGMDDADKVPSFDVGEARSNSFR
jgi:hypothetical protein